MPSRVYARPLVLRPGLVLAPDGLVKLLNGLRYAQRDGGPGGGRAVLRFRRGGSRSSHARSTPARRSRSSSRSRPTSRGVTRVKEIRGEAPKKRYAEQAARAGARHLPVRREPREAAPRALRGAARPPGQGGARHRGPPLLQPPRPRPVPPRWPRSCATSAPTAPSPRAAARSPSSSCKNFFLTPERTLPAQGAGGPARVRARAAGHEAGDPRALPQRDLPRPVGLVQHQRRGRGGPHLLPQGRGQPHPARVGAARRA